MKKYSVLIPFILMIMSANSQDRYFARTYTTNVLPKGDFDIELWHTSRFGHADQFYHAMDQRMEYEVGLGHNLQTAFYFNRYQESFSNNTDQIEHKNEIGFSNEWKWKLSDPSQNKVGTALYSELGVKGDELELETKIILDKSFGRNLIAFNGVYEIEWESEKENGKYEWGTEATPFEFDLSYMRQFSINFGAGIEAVNHNDLVKGNWNNSILYAGPTINYRGDKWFVIVNYLPQLINLKKTTTFPGNKVLNEHERAEARIVFGFSF